MTTNTFKDFHFEQAKTWELKVSDNRGRSLEFSGKLNDPPARGLEFKVVHPSGSAAQFGGRSDDYFYRELDPPPGITMKIPSNEFTMRLNTPPPEYEYLYRPKISIDAEIMSTKVLISQFSERPVKRVSDVEAHRREIGTTQWFPMTDEEISELVQS